MGWFQIDHKLTRQRVEISKRTATNVDQAEPRVFCLIGGFKLTTTYQELKNYEEMVSILPQTISTTNQLII